MKKLSMIELNILIDLAERTLQQYGTITQMVNKIYNVAYNRCYKVDRKEVRHLLLTKMAKEILKELN